MLVQNLRGILRSVDSRRIKYQCHANACNACLPPF